jgi:hypothetical protein
MQTPDLCEIRSFIPEALIHSTVLPRAPVQKRSPRLGTTTASFRPQHQDRARPESLAAAVAWEIHEVAVIPRTVAGLSNDAFTGANHHED